MRRTSLHRFGPVPYLAAALLIAVAAGCGDSGGTTTNGGDDAAGAADTASTGDAGPDDASSLPPGCDCLAVSDCPSTAGCGEVVCEACECIVSPANEGADCDDGNPCTSNGVCEGGTCVGDVMGCDDGDDCTADSCLNAPVCPEGELVEGTCVLAVFTLPLGISDATAECDARGAALLSVESDAANQGAAAAAASACGDIPFWIAEPGDFTAWADGEPGAGAGVTSGPDGLWHRRDEAGCVACELPADPFGCVHTYDEAGNGSLELCNGVDDDCDGVIDDGADLCEDGDLCTMNSCLGTAGCLTGELPGECDDDFPCTTDSCDPAVGCVHVADDALCDDGVSCTADVCEIGVGCVAVPDDGACSDGLDCTLDACEPGTGCVFAPDDAACDDGTDCTTDRCLQGEGCRVTPDHTACDDGEPCTHDVCTAGEGCSNPSASSACDDGDACTTTDVCVGGVCQGSGDLVCDDGLPCTADSCDPVSGCTSAAVDGCKAPGPHAGFYVGTFDYFATFDLAGVPVPEGKFFLDPNPPSGDWTIDLGIDVTCSGTLEAIVDAADDPEVATTGFAACTLLLRFDVNATGFWAAYFDGSFPEFASWPDSAESSDFVAGPAPEGFASAVAGEENGYVGSLAMNALSVVADFDVTVSLDLEGRPLALALDGDGVQDNTALLPAVISLVEEAYLPLEDIVEAVPSAAIETFESLDSLPMGYTLTADLDRVDVIGTCCGGPGCEDGVSDADCLAKGWAFVPSVVGKCKQPDGTYETHTDAITCDFDGGSFVPAPTGACCLTGEDVVLACEEVSQAECGFKEGNFVVGIPCGDANDDGHQDACGLPTNYADSGPEDCSVDADGVLSVDLIGDDLVLKLKSDWQQDGNSFVTGSDVGGSSTVTLLAPDVGGVSIPLEIDIEDVTQFQVGCDAPLTISGAGNKLPLMGPTDLAPDTLEFEGLSVAFGFDYGYQLAELGIEAPVADARPYLFASVNTASKAKVGPNVTVDLLPGDKFTLAVDPTDPAFFVEVDGNALSTGSAGLVNKAGFGASRGGYLTWKSKRDLFDGANFTPRIKTGHLYRNGEFALVPYPNLPANIFVDGDVIIDVGGHIEHIKAIGEALLAATEGEDGVGAVAQVLENAVGPATALEILEDISLAGNANALKISEKLIGFSISLADATWEVTDGTLAFSAEGLTPGAALAGAGGALETLGQMAFSGTSGISGYVNLDRLHLQMTTDIIFGGFSYKGARLIIDTKDGVLIEGGAFGFDPAAFLEALKNILTCNYDEEADETTCAAFGIETFKLALDVGDDGFFLDGAVTIPIFGEIALTADIGSDGSFTVTGSAAAGAPGVQSGAVTFTVTDTGLAMETTIQQFNTTFIVSGMVMVDTATGDLAYELSGTANAQLATMNATMTLTLSGVGETPPTLTGNATLTPLGYDIEGSFEFDLNNETWSFTGTGTMEYLGFELASVTATASNIDETALKISGEIGIGTANVMLIGEVSSTSVLLGATLDLTIAGITLSSANVTLNLAGLLINGTVTLLGFESTLEGAVESNGDFSLTAAAGSGGTIDGVDFDFAASIIKSGSQITAGGAISVVFAGHTFSKAIALSASTAFSWSHSVGVYACASLGAGVNGCLAGSVHVKLTDKSFDAWFAGTASVGDVSVSLPKTSISSSGVVCVDFPGPVGGNACVDVL